MQTFAVIALVAVLVSFGESTNFCEKFKDNGNKISFGYRRIWGKDLNANYLVIKDLLWQLKFTDDLDNKKHLEIAGDGQQSQWFTNGWMSFCIGNENKFETGLLFPNKTIKWANIGDGLKVTADIKTSQMNVFDTSFIPEVAFVPSDHELEWHEVYFLGKSGGQRKLEVYDLKDKDNPKRWVWTDTSSDVIKIRTHFPTIYESLDNKLDVIAVINQYSSADHNVKKNGFAGQGTFVLVQLGSAIKYCYKTLYESNDLNQNQCKEKDLQTLIECSKDDTKTNDKTGDNPGDPPKNGYIKYIIIGVLVFAAIAIIGAIVYVVYMNGSKKDGGNEQVSALSSAAPSATPSTVSAERSALSKAPTKKPSPSKAPSTASQKK